MLDLVGEVNGVHDADELRAAFLPALLRVVPADWASYNEVLEGRGPIATLTSPPATLDQHEAWGRSALTNPLIQRYVRTRDGRAYRFSDVVSEDELHALPVYRDFYGPMGVEHQIAFTLPAPRELTIGIALSRSLDKEDFSQVERAMLDLARPHLIQAYRNAQLRPGGDPTLAAAAIGPLPTEALRALGLTLRQAEVLAALAQGRSTEEVAALLAMSPRTVHKHAQAIHARLGVRDRSHAVATAWAAVGTGLAGHRG